MKIEHPSRFRFCNSRIFVGFVLCVAVYLGASSLAQTPQENSGIQWGQSYHNDVSPALRDVPALWPPRGEGDNEEMREANLNPRLPLPLHVDVSDSVIDRGVLGLLVPDIMPATILNFDGVPYPGVGCFCAPPDTNGAVGSTQYVQIVNKAYQVFDKTTGASLAGPTTISGIWSGFGGVCENNGRGDPVALYDHLANRWLISQFAGTNIPTDECIAISTSSDATGTYNRYGFHLGSNFFDYPHFGVWPDGYYMAMNIFTSSFIGPQAFAFDRTKMLAGQPATFVSPGITGGPTEDSFLPSDLDGAILPTSGVGNPFVSFPGSGFYKVRLFHADFVTPANTTFSQIGAPTAAGFTVLCPQTRACVPQLGTTNKLDAIGDRLMFRLAYRKFGDGHEAVVGNYTVSAGGVAGVRWFELRNVTTAPTVFQESTYQPDTTWRWMGSAGMDQSGDLAIGFSASNATINPQIRYAGRLVGDPVNILSRGEAHLFDGTGSQTSGLNRWGDYSSLTLDPVDDCTFWYTQEYIAADGSFNWKTRIGNFKFTQCTSVPKPVLIPHTSSLTNEGCAPNNQAIDPNETVTVSFCVQNGGTLATTSNLTGTLLNTGGVTGASGPQNYGVIGPDSTVCKPFTFTATGTCGGVLTATIHFQDGLTDLGNAVFTLILGKLTPTLSENFDGVTHPALPAGWVATNAVNPDNVAWVTSTISPDSVPNDAFINDPSSISDKLLETPSILINSASGQVSFRNNYNLESSFDGGVLEISVNGGSYNDIIAAGGTFATGGYNATISAVFSSPIAGRRAWSGDSGGYINTIVNLPSNVNGQNIKLRFRMASDSAVAGTGWRVDTVFVSSTYVCCVTPTPVPTVSISGTITYCSNPILPPVPNVTLTLTGTSSGSTLSNSSGNYSFSSLPSGGNYQVVPTKAALAPGSSGINSIDVAAIQKHFNQTQLLTGCRLTAADVNGDTLVNTIDVLAVQKFFLAQSGNTFNTGKYQFNPSNRSYLGLVINQTSQNYDAIVFGDVAGGYVHRPEGVSTTAAQVSTAVAMVALPDIDVDQLRKPSRVESTNTFAAVTTSAIDANSNLIGFQGDFTFDERVIAFANEPVQKAGLTDGNWNVSGNVLPGEGPIRTLRISAFSIDSKPLSGSGTLFELRVRTVSDSALRIPNSEFPLVWAAPPDNFIFIDGDLNPMPPNNAAPGSVTLRLPGRIPNPSSF